MGGRSALASLRNRFSPSEVWDGSRSYPTHLASGVRWIVHCGKPQFAQTKVRTSTKSSPSHRIFSSDSRAYPSTQYRHRWHTRARAWPSMRASLRASKISRPENIDPTKRQRRGRAISTGSGKDMSLLQALVNGVGANLVPAAGRCPCRGLLPDVADAGRVTAIPMTYQR